MVWYAYAFLLVAALPAFAACGGLGHISEELPGGVGELRAAVGEALVTGNLALSESHQYPGARESAQGQEYAVMAVVPRRGRWFWGFAADPFLRLARVLALAKCGHPDCIVVQEFGERECAYVVLGNEQVFWAAEPPASLPQLLNLCRSKDSNCKVKVEWCSFSGHKSKTVDSSGESIAPLTSAMGTN